MQSYPIHAWIFVWGMLFIGGFFGVLALGAIYRSISFQELIALLPPFITGVYLALILLSKV